MPVPQEIPASLVQDCNPVRPEQPTYGNTISALLSALDECNKDKAALRNID